MRNSLSSLCICLFFCVAVMSCVKEPEAKYFPGDITGDWYNQNDPTNIFSIRIDDPPSRIPLTYRIRGTEKSSTSLTIKQFNGYFTETEIFWEYYNNGFQTGKVYSGTLNATATLMTPRNSSTVTLIKK